MHFFGLIAVLSASSVRALTTGSHLQIRTPFPLAQVIQRSKVVSVASASASASTSESASKTIQGTTRTSSPTSTSTSTSTLFASNRNSEEDPKCPVTIFSRRVAGTLSTLDDKLINRILRIVSHVPALMSLSYFGLVSMAQMMEMGPMANTAGTVAKATLSSVLTSNVGATTNQAFAAYFPTLVTPAPFVFLVWPIIVLLQGITVSISALFPSKDEILTQRDLSALTIANLCSTAWLLASSNATPGNLPIASFLVLPLVPLFSGYPLRNKPKYMLWAYQVYSSFTIIASILAFTVELQFGGRIPLIGTVGKEVAASIFLALFSMTSLAVGNKTGAKKIVNFGAISGILYRRVSAVLVGGMGGMASVLSGMGSLLLSVSFLGTIGCWVWSVKSFFVGRE